MSGDNADRIMRDCELAVERITKRESFQKRLENMRGRLSYGFPLTVDEQRELWEIANLPPLEPIRKRCFICGGNGCGRCEHTGYQNGEHENIGRVGGKIVTNEPPVVRDDEPIPDGWFLWSIRRYVEIVGIASRVAGVIAVPFVVGYLFWLIWRFWPY